jgi:EpsI family protein
LFPKTFGDWRIDDRQPVQLVSPDQLAMINRIYNQTLSRTYVNVRGDRIMLSVAYGGDQSDAARAHRPEVCYPAQGFEIIANQVARLALPSRALPVRQLMARQGGRLEPITYWMTVGERIALSGTQQKLAQLTYSTRGLVPDGMLVRVSSIDADKDKAYIAHAGFISQLSQGMAQGPKARVFGEAGA